MKTAEIVSLLGAKGRMIAGKYYTDHLQDAEFNDKNWFSTGFKNLVSKSVNHALEVMGKTERVSIQNDNIANGVANKINP